MYSFLFGEFLQDQVTGALSGLQAPLDNENQVQSPHGQDRTYLNKTCSCQHVSSHILVPIQDPDRTIHRCDLRSATFTAATSEWRWARCRFCCFLVTCTNSRLMVDAARYTSCPTPAEHNSGAASVGLTAAKRRQEEGKLRSSCLQTSTACGNFSSNVF